jgi:hypothetical protein
MICYFQTVLLLALAFCIPATAKAQSAASAGSSEGKDAVLKATDITTKLFPAEVFYQGKTAPAELRNTGGVHFADGAYFLVGLVDTAGYSTSVREKYQAYLLTEAPVEFGGQLLKAGAYGAGFVGGNFVITDLGAHDLFQVPAKHDADMKRPIPLQVTADTAAGTYRLYRGRDYVEFRRAQ